MKAFLEELAEQRWDDHRFYHQSRVNQSLHFISSLSFLCAYVLLFIEPAWAALLGWGVSMTTRQAGHFFFEPRGFDKVNNVTDEYKEAVKVGYNIRRKVVLMGAWLALPALLWLEPSVFGLIEPARDLPGYLHDLGIAWLALAAGGLTVRVLQLAVQRDLRTGLVWLCKIITDPFHDAVLYHRAPIALLRGEWLDPMEHVRQH